MKKEGPPLPFLSFPSNTHTLTRNTAQLRRQPRRERVVDGDRGCGCCDSRRELAEKRERETEQGRRGRESRIFARLFHCTHSHTRLCVCPGTGNQQMCVCARSLVLFQWVQAKDRQTGCMRTGNEERTVSCFCLASLSQPLSIAASLSSSRLPCVCSAGSAVSPTLDGGCCTKWAAGAKSDYSCRETLKHS